jgi:hypothetical protein
MGHKGSWLFYDRATCRRPRIVVVSPVPNCEGPGPPSVFGYETGATRRVPPNSHAKHGRASRCWTGNGKQTAELHGTHPSLEKSEGWATQLYGLVKSAPPARPGQTLKNSQPKQNHSEAKNSQRNTIIHKDCPRNKWQTYR